MSMPVAEKQVRHADIAFCLDITASMQPGIDALKQSIREFVEVKLQRSVTIDARLALIGFRNKHEEGASQYLPGKKVCEEEWVQKDFTESPTIFLDWLDGINAVGGGIETPYDPNDAPESALDAIYIAIHQLNWREHKCHRVIVLLTDSDTRRTLHETTYKRPDNGIERVIQDLQTMNHAALYIYVPKTESYVRLEKGMGSADRNIVALFIDDDKMAFDVDRFDKLLEMISQSVTETVLSENAN